MFSDIKKLFNQSFVYGLGDVLNRIASFLLLPLYTNYLTPKEFGILEIFYVTASVLGLFLGRQLSHATLRFYFEYDQPKERNLVISTCFVLYIIFAGTILGLCITLSKVFSNFIFTTSNYSKYFIVLFIWMFFDLSKEVLYSYIRAIEKARFFVIISFLEMVTKLLLCTYFVVALNWNVFGVLMGNLGGASLAWIILSIYTIKRCGTGIDLSKFSDIMKYTIPLIFVGVSGTIIGNADRFFLKSFSSLAAVGLYGLAMRFSSLLRFLVLQPFTKGYGPFRFSIMKQENAKAIYSRVTTYFFFFCAWIALGIIAFSREVIHIMAEQSYWNAFPIIPLLLVAVFGQALYYMFQIGVYINKNTKVLTYVFAIAAALNLLCLWIFVPIMGPIGAALSLAITQIFIALMGLYCSHRVYYVKYEWSRLAKIATIFLVFLPFCFISYNINPYWSAFVKVPVVLIYPLIFFVIGFFYDGEVSKIKEIKLRIAHHLQRVGS